MKSMKAQTTVVGILAHVDSGKTTLAESLLYKTGAIKTLGRVDHKDAYLDTFDLEKDRGITIFSKEAHLKFGDKEVVLLDTPGHVDFSTEMERTLRVLDYAILVISGKDGISGHTRTLWNLLDKYQIPTFIFVNKMDQEGAIQKSISRLVQEKLSNSCIAFNPQVNREVFMEELAMTDEEVMEQFFDIGEIEKEQIQQLILERKVFPCFYGSALTLQGVEEFIEGLNVYTKEAEYTDIFSAQVYKISRDQQGNRLAHIKVTGGSLEVKAKIQKLDLQDAPLWEEKVNQIRLCSGNKYESVNEVTAGSICAVTGLSKANVGDGLGKAIDWELPQLQAVMSYNMEFSEEVNIHQMYGKLQEIAEEDPCLDIAIQESTQKLQAKLMGQIQMEILESIIKERFQTDVNFTEPTIVYKETISKPVLGIGHFEPLRHYAEVHLLIEPLERGSGMEYASACHVDDFPAQWQNLVFTHLQEISHPGVLLGAPITDVKITIVGGRGHEKHTVGGDFREATYRALQQGLMQGESKILEPVYAFNIEVPATEVGRVLHDITQMNGRFEAPLINGDQGIITGVAPVVTIREYPREVISFTKGFGVCHLQPIGYEEVEDTQTILQNRDKEGPVPEFTPDSVFCKQGAGFNVPWDKVHEYAHVDSGICLTSEEKGENLNIAMPTDELTIDLEEIDEIMARAYKNSGKKVSTYKQKPKGPITVASGNYTYRPLERKEEFLIVDGYNIIFAWEELKELAQVNIESAKGKLMDILSNYQGFKKCKVILVFDAYKVKDYKGESQAYHNISVVYTKTAETADAYIEKVAHKMSKEFDVIVATSDVVEQLIIMSAGARKLSAKQLWEEVKHSNNELQTEYLDEQKAESIQTIGDIIEKKARE